VKSWENERIPEDSLDVTRTDVKDPIFCPDELACFLFKFNVISKKKFVLETAMSLTPTLFVQMFNIIMMNYYYYYIFIYNSAAVCMT